MNQQDINDVISTEAQLAILTAFKDGYEPACEIYDEFVGRNSRTFGFDLHFTLRQALVNVAQRFPEEIRVLKNAGRFELMIGNKVTSFYRIAKNLSVNLMEAFPANKNAGFLSEKNQTAFDFGEDDVEIDYGYLIGHIGNQFDGLLGLYLCEVGKTEKGEIKEWKSIHTIWIADESSEHENHVAENEVLLDDVNIIKDETVIKIKEGRVEEQA